MDGSRPKTGGGLRLLATASPRVGRAILLALAATSASLVTATFVWGPVRVDLDSLLQNPVELNALVAAPALLAMASIVAATLPRVARINIAVFVGLLVLGEGVSWIFAPSRPTIAGGPVAMGAPAFFIPDASLGYALAPATVARHRRTVDDVAIYDVLYRTDERGRRETPTGAHEERTSFLLFFGDSNLFGEGLPQTETIPYHAGSHARGHRPYNYGVPGYGPAQLLALARSGHIRREVVERDGYAVFFLIPAHVERVIGSTKVSTGWGRHFPYYEEGDHGELVTRGAFLNRRPFTTLGYFFWTRSHLVAYFGVDLPLWYAAGDYRLIAKIFKEASDLLSRQLQVRRFVVVLGQTYNAAQLRVIRALGDALAREGIFCLDYTALFDTRDSQYRLSELDYHNSAKANRIIAARLVSDLGIAR